MNEALSILCVHHATQRDDRVSRILSDKGFRLIWVNPARGERLPDTFDDYTAAVVYGGEQSANDDTDAMRVERAWIERWVKADKPYLGLCLGGQLLARALGASVCRHDRGLLENGYTLIHPDEGGRFLIPEPMYVFQWHNEGFEVPPGCTRLAHGSRFENQAFSYRPHIIGLQFHPEVTPQIMYQWFREGGHMLTDPGAQCAEMQLRDAQTFETGIETWAVKFLDHWISRAVERHFEPDQATDGRRN